MRLYGTGKGYGRQVTKVICRYCGSNTDVTHDDLNEVYICQSCIEKEQNILDDQEYRRNEELDNEQDD